MRGDELVLGEWRAARIAPPVDFNLKQGAKQVGPCCCRQRFSVIGNAWRLPVAPFQLELITASVDLTPHLGGDQLFRSAMVHGLHVA
jgi:hypothetical protein